MKFNSVAQNKRLKLTGLGLRGTAAGLAFLNVCVQALPAEPSSSEGEDVPFSNTSSIGQTPRLPPVIVTGTPINDQVPEVPLNSVGSRSVFGPDQVRETGAREINDLMMYVPALSTRPYNGGEAAAPSFSMRGLPDDGLTEYINLLIDGVPASPMPFGWTAPSFFPATPDRIHAIDYLRGAHSVRYSPNTVGGVLNFITTPIPMDPSATLRGTFGNFGYRSLMGQFGGTWDQVGLGATYNYRSGDGYREHGGFTQHDTNVKGRYQLTEKSGLAFSVSYMENEHQAPGGLTQAQFAANRFGNARPDNRFDGNRLVTDAVYHRDLETGGWMEGFTYFSKTERNLHAQRPHFDTPTDSLHWNDTSYFIGTGVRVDKPIMIGNIEHALYGGFRYQREWLPHYRIWSEPFGGGPRALTQDQDFTLDTLSLHLDDTFQPIDRLTVQVGVRLEWVPNVEGMDRVSGWNYDDDYFTALPGFGLAYEITDSWAVFGNYFHGFRSPQAWGFGSATQAGQGLDFENSRSAEIGTRLRGFGGLEGAVTLWRNEYDNLGVFYEGFYNNLGEILAKGIDFELEWHAGQVWSSMDGFSVFGAFTLQDSELRSGPFAGNDVPYAWHQKASWRFRYARAGWIASLGGTYVSDSYSDEANTAVTSANGNLGRNPSRVIWDARLGRFFNLCRNADLELALGANNLFDKDWHMHSRGGFFGPGLAAGPPRQLYGTVGLNVRF